MKKRGWFGRAKKKFINQKIYEWTLYGKDTWLEWKSGNGWHVHVSWSNNYERQIINSIIDSGSTEGFLKARKLMIRKLYNQELGSSSGKWVIVFEKKVEIPV